MDEEYDFDVAVSFAGENRGYVEAVVADLHGAGHKVFYDEDNDVDMWGHDLTEYFANVYEKRARFAVMFVSAAYAQKVWTVLERRHILARALEQVTPYVLPVRLDSTTLPGLRATVAYLDGSRKSPAEIANAIRTKLGAPAGTGRRQSNGLTPVDEHEAALLLGERPVCWEYTYFAWRLQVELKRHEMAYNDFVAGYTEPGDYITDEGVVDYALAYIARQRASARAIERMLLGPAQVTAFGEPGQHGNPELIDHLAARLGNVYRQMIDAANAVRSTACHSEEAYEALFALSEMHRQPVEDYRTFVRHFADEVNSVAIRVQNGESVSLTLVLALTIPDEASLRVDVALKRFGARFR